MRAQLISENIDFKRGQDSKEALSVGKAANPLILMNFQEEVTYEGPILKASDLPKDGNTWDNEVEPAEAHNILSNWKKYAHKFHSALAMNRDNDADDEYEHILAPELEGEYVQYGVKTYYIPETGMMSESVDFKRTKNSKKSLGVGDQRPIQIGDKFEILVDLYWHPGAYGKKIGQWYPRPQGKLSDAHPLLKGHIVNVTEFDDLNSGEEWVEVFADNGIRRNHLKIDWVKKYLNKYLRRI